MMPVHPADLLEFIDAIPFDDEPYFRARQALVDELGLDEVTLLATLGILQVAPVAFAGTRFDIEISGVEPVTAVVMGVLDRYEAIIDLVAWPVDQPERMATFAGCVAMLGAPQLNETRTAFSPPLKIHRTALSWLRAGQIGIVPLDLQRAARALIDADGRFEAEDDRHGLELQAAMAELAAIARFVVSTRQRKAA